MSAWSEWRAVSPVVRCSEKVLTELVDGGQAFRWNQVDGVLRGVWGHYIAELRSVDETVEWRAPQRIADQVAREIALYLGADETFTPIWDALPHRSDPALGAAMANWPGLRILRQPFGETVLGFLCSSMKQIPSIKLICETLAKRFGREIIPGVHALPDWSTLHHVSETELRAAGLGYRARHIHVASHFLAGQPGWLDVVEQLPYPEAKERLMQLPGVGAKIADCALLFGAGRLEAFPVDTWIKRIMSESYGLQDWKLDQVAHFGRVHFGEYAGLAQQFLFSNARKK
ncbi:DNA-3-methyladenine glycosylase family protein [Cerasicoccus frondis]|uniref:DNA-3-methyladenine glycosylase family protein n=1 Tax=Cerasicoccus frondis TaxID=490090 RepID=UPI002852B338|nr:DNA glycosylase [Cerasicoccus frondis]